MPSYKILPAAEKDLDEHALHIAGDNLDAALRLYDAAEETYQMLAGQPKMGELYPSENPLLADMRFFPIKGFGKYLAFYHPTEKTIEIVRVLHTSRDIKSILT